MGTSMCSCMSDPGAKSIPAVSAFGVYLCFASAPEQTLKTYLGGRHGRADAQI